MSSLFDRTRTLEQRRQAVSNLFDFLVRGGIADTSRMPSDIIDEGHKSTVHRYHPVGTMTGEVPGDELAEIHDRFLANRKITSYPAVAKDAIDPQRTYTLVLPYELVVKLGQRRKILSNVANGPEITVHELARRVFR